MENTDKVERATFRIPTPADKMREHKPCYYIAESIAKNIKVESETIEECMDLLSRFNPDEDAIAINKIKDIVSDKKRHIDTFSELMKAYDGNIETK